MKSLNIYAVAVTILCAVSINAAFTQQNQILKFDEIDVERINIVEKDGQLRMVISNRARQHPGMIDGKLIKRKHGRPPGMIFFNHRGDECGGLVFDENGENGHFVSLTMDKFRNDQTVGIQHLESENGDYFAGLLVWDRPNHSSADISDKIDAIQQMPDEADRKAAFKKLRDRGEFGTQRITVGKLRNKTAMIELLDAKGKPRITISVGPNGDPRMSFLDENGKVTYTLPERETSAE